MKITLADKFIAWLTLFCGLSLSAVAIYYSVAGLVSIFAAAVVPIVIMGAVLEISKLVATVWLKQNWFIAPRAIKGYLLTAIVLLMFITSMGIFGYLSKAHMDQTLVSGDAQSKIAIYDEKIKTERENIDAARRALKQMDEAVDQTMARSTTEQGATRSAQLRRQQQAERSRLQKDITTAQSNISRLNEERAPIAAEVRKVEAEVGPIKYIAALLYGDNPDQNLLEAAVRWVIIMIVIVFDPLAVILLLASQYSFSWFRKSQEEEDSVKPDAWVADVGEKPTEEELKDDLFPTYEEITPKDDSNEIPQVNNTEELKDAVTDDIHDNAGSDGQRDDLGSSRPDTVLDTDAQELVEDDNPSTKAAKMKWKSENPHDTLKHQEWLYSQGLINQLPWEQVEAIEEKLLEETPSTGKNTLLSDIMDPKTFEVGADNFTTPKKKSTFMIKEEDQQIKKTKE